MYTSKVYIYVGCSSFLDASSALFHIKSSTKFKIKKNVISISNNFWIVLIFYDIRTQHIHTQTSAKIIYNTEKIWCN